MKNTKKGFTLIELLIVIGIIAILAGIVLVAVNPAQQFGKANDSERKSEIGMILSAIYQYQTSPSARGELPSCFIDGNPEPIPACGTSFAGAKQLGTGLGNYDCSATGLLVPSYLREIPIDPKGEPDYNETATGYYVCQSDPGLPTSTVYVLAPHAEVYFDDGCQMDLGGTVLEDAMCVSG